MRRALDSIPPIKSDLLPPVDALAAGVTRDGRQLYRRVKQIVTTEPKINPATGEQQWRINQMGQQTVAVRKVTSVTPTEELFYLENEGNGNVRKIPYRHPTPDELAASEREKKIAAMGGGSLAAALVDAGISPQEAIARLVGAKTAPETASPQTATSPKPAAEVFPKFLGGGWYVLSTGLKFQGKQADAEAAEAEVTDDERAAAAEAKANAEATPEE